MMTADMEYAYLAQQYADSALTIVEAFNINVELQLIGKNSQADLPHKTDKTPNMTGTIYRIKYTHIDDIKCTFTQNGMQTLYFCWGTRWPFGKQSIIFCHELIHDKIDGWVNDD